MTAKQKVARRVSDGWVVRGADMSLTGFHPLWNKILSQILQAAADRGCHLEGSSPYKGTAYRGVCCTGYGLCEYLMIREGANIWGGLPGRSYKRRFAPSLVQ
jgi:hypothetical protein